MSQQEDTKEVPARSRGNSDVRKADQSAPQTSHTQKRVEAPAEEEQQKEKNEEGKKIGGFIIGKTKGKGTFGKVKQGTHIVTGDKVAIKILEKDKIKDQSDVERVTREIHILKIVRHPNVI